MSLIALFFFPLPLRAQQREPFTITGKSDWYDNRGLYLFVGTYPLFINDRTLTPKNTDSLYCPKTLVRNGKFAFSSSLRYPHPLSVSYYDAKNNYGHTSDFYFIDGGELRIRVDDLAKNKTLGNAVRNEANEEYGRLKKLYSGLADTLKHGITDRQAKQKIMHAYIVAHPNSFVALRDLLFDYSRAGKDSVKRSILENAGLFSPLLKKSNTHRALLNFLKKDLEPAAGKLFPDLNLKPAVSLKQAVKENKFTLVDFWFLHCVPYLNQLPGLKKVYAAYKEKRFSITGISIDSRENETYRQKTTQKSGLTWPQYLDEHGKEAQRLNVNAYPTNFLLYEKGVIVKKDISSEVLNLFLEKNLTR